jgi:hypothetical protein
MVNLNTISCSLLLVIGQTEAFAVGRGNAAVTANAFAVRTSYFAAKQSERSDIRPLAGLPLASSAADDEYSIDPSNIPFGVVWVALLAFTTFVAPGDFQSDYDNNIIQAIIANPQNPDINELFFFVFNLFAIIPTALACVVFPQASKQGPPAAPFVIAASFLGYFAFGPYLLLRGKQKEETSLSELGWITANVLENKIFNAGSLALALFFATQVSWGDFSSLAQGYSEMAQQSKFVTVSSVDLFLLSATVASFIPQDYKLRNPEDSDRANLIAASTMLLPVFGSAIYCILRPQLPEE